jgi:microcystin-dependent protein
MSEPFLGEIRIFCGNFAPQGWAMCNGQVLGIAQNSALFSILGTTYGGNGTTTFLLPDLRGRAALHYLQGNGLSNYALGETGGVEAVTLVAGQMPQHTHNLAAAATSTTPTPSAAVVLGEPSASVPAYAGATMTTALAANAVGLSTGGQPHENRQPILAMNYIIALVGIYPARN